jgi:hypothetical protein
MEQHKAILERTLPDNLKLSIAKRIENNLFAKVQAHIPVANMLPELDLTYGPYDLSTGTLLEWNAWCW